MYTIKSVSDEGIYYLVNHARDYKTYWVEKRDLKHKMLYDRAADAKASLTKLLKIMNDYKADKFYLVKINTYGNIESEEELQMQKKTLTNKELIKYAGNGVVISTLLAKATKQFDVFTNILNTYTRQLYIIGASDKVSDIFMQAKSSADLCKIVMVVKNCEDKEVDINRLDLATGELRLFCEAFDFKNNECLTENYDMWQEQFGSDFYYSVRGEIREYIEACQ